ncbi:hypothetical protein HID58_083714 [Brassica napus]|uniref:Amino acid transporter transmembrane domain-containing protein n=1 Tax=Brassica napus TaxID=3708 RepID=A0ABQ7YGQ5_BRANA|nr:hypothetical protein HID58_083714 [Brassica napus]
MSFTLHWLSLYHFPLFLGFSPLEMKSFHTEYNPSAVEAAGNNFDDDGREKRTGTVMTASAHIITAVIGSGVLSLAWAIAQLGWVAGTVILVTFAVINYFTSTMLADCYRSPDTGIRNYNYMDVVRAYLGGWKVKLCGLAQYGSLVGITIGYTITASISLVAIGKANCFHEKGHGAKCSVSNYPLMAAFGIIQIVLSQIHNFHKLSFLSIIATVMSFSYASIGIGLALAALASGKVGKTDLTGTVVGVDVTASDKIWRSFQAAGDIAFSYAFSVVLVEIQACILSIRDDTLRSSPPENKVMKKASLAGVSTTTGFYILCGCIGYAAFGNQAPGDFLTDFGFYEPYWLIDFANACIAVHLIAAYQVFAQPIFQFIEKKCNKAWPESNFITKDYSINIPLLGKCRINFFRLVWRSTYVILTTVAAMIFPFFNAILGLIGALTFWPLTVYFPVEMHISQKKVKKYTMRWIGLKLLVLVCLVVSLLAAVGSIVGLIISPLNMKSFDTSSAVESGTVAGNNVDDDGGEKRTGTLMTASAHIITAVIGSGVLSLAWAIAQLGWVAGTVLLVSFAVVVNYTSRMLADCYRSPDAGTRNNTYMDVVRAYLGGRKVQLCGLAQYGSLVGMTIGYTITASISFVAIGKANCFHDKGHGAKFSVSNYPAMAAFGIIQIVLSQIPNFHKLSFLSIIAAVMSFSYSSIGTGLALADLASGKVGKTELTGTVVGVDVTASDKLWKSFQAAGNIAFSYAYSVVLVEIQACIFSTRNDTLSSSPPENIVMKKASIVGVSTATAFYILCACMGYATFGSQAPGDLLTDFGFYEPYWLIDFANACIAVHLIGAYQVIAQPIFQFVEKKCNKAWPESNFITKEHSMNIPLLGKCRINFFRLVWRTIYVIFSTVIAMIFPFFNAVLGLIGAVAFWPLTVYFPVEMHISQKKIKKYTMRWIGLKLLVLVCLIVSLLAAVGSIVGLIISPLKMKSFDTSSVVESGAGAGNNVDDDCREKRTGTLITASAHIITTVIGSGVLSLAWAIAQLGWVVGTVILVAFAVIVNYTSRMLADSYRSPEGTRNYTYMDVVRVYLGGRKVQLCGLAQFGSLVGVTIGYTITASISLVAIGKANCFHDKGHGAKCSVSNYPLMAAFGIVQIFLSQIPNFHKLSFLSIIATVMSFSYASIGFGLALAALASGKVGKTGLTGTVVGVDVTASDKLWKSFQAAGNIAFSYAYSVVLVEIQACILSINDDTLRSSPPENKVMKKASLAAVSTTTAFYILCGCIGYATFGNQAPGDFLTDFGFYEPYWLIDFANACIAVHLIGAYQVFAQPIFQFVEKKCNQAWPESNFITKEHSMNVPLLGKCRINFFRLVWRTTYVIFSTVVAMIFPFFNAILGLIGAVAFWPLTVYFPVEMHISQKKVKKYSVRWIVLKLLVFVCLIVSLLAAIGSIVGLISSVKAYKPFHNLD